MDTAGAIVGIHYSSDLDPAIAARIKIEVSQIISSPLIAAAISAKSNRLEIEFTSLGGATKGASYGETIPTDNGYTLIRINTDLIYVNETGALQNFGAPKDLPDYMVSTLVHELGHFFYPDVATGAHGPVPEKGTPAYESKEAADAAVSAVVFSQLTNNLLKEITGQTSAYETQRIDSNAQLLDDNRPLSSIDIGLSGSWESLLSDPDAFKSAVLGSDSKIAAYIGKDVVIPDIHDYPASLPIITVDITENPIGYVEKIYNRLGIYFRKEFILGDSWSAENFDESGFTTSFEYKLASGEILKTDMFLPLPPWWSKAGPFLVPVTSPLALDLDGGGVSAVRLAASRAFFDMNLDGRAERGSWVGPGEALIALDLNGNGRIDDASELFGEQRGDGFSSLAVYDLNADGRIDEADPIFESLLAWRDVNQDGFSNLDEIDSLRSVGVKSIGLNAAQVSQTREGNPVTHIGSAVMSDGSSREVVDIWFQRDPVLVRGETHGDLSPAAASLPNVPGYGTLDDLRVEMDRDPTLMSAVSHLVADSGGSSPETFRMTAEAILLGWSHSGDVSATSRGQYVNAQHLDFLEKLYGQPYGIPLTHDSEGVKTLGSAQAASVEGLYQQIVGTFSAQIAAQIVWASDATNPYAAFSHVVFPALGGSVENAAAQFLSYILQKAPSDPSLLINYLKPFKSLSVDAGLDFNDNPFWHAQYLGSVLPGIAGSSSQAAISATNIIAVPAGGGTTINSDGSDTFIMGPGSDVVRSTGSQNGSDFYVVHAGGLNDSITDLSNGKDNSIDTLLLPDHLATQVALNYGPSLSLWIVGSNSLVNMTNQAKGSVTSDGIERIVFADGTIWTSDTFAARAEIPAYQTGNGQSEKLLGWVGRDVISGMGGDDTIDASDGDDVLIGGAGTDRLIGGKGADTYVYRLGDGSDKIEEALNQPGTDILHFTDGMPDQLVFRQVGATLQIDVAGTNDTIEIASQFTNYGPVVEGLRFEDGSIWSKQDILEHLTITNHLVGTAAANTLSMSSGDPAWLEGLGGNDSLTGGNSRDQLDGGSGNDTLSGGNGPDIYIYAQGYGSDTISELSATDFSRDVIEFGPSISPLTVSVAQVGTSNDVAFSFVGSPADKLTLKGFLNTSSLENQYRGDEIHFSDGTAWKYGDVADRSFAFTSGNDVISGDYRDNTLMGGAGDDTLSGGEGSDRLIGESGSDLLKGGIGNDTFVFAPGFGKDTILDFAAGPAVSDVIQFDRSVFSDFTTVLGHATQVGSDVIIAANDVDSLTLKNLQIGTLHQNDFLFV